MPVLQGTQLQSSSVGVYVSVYVIPSHQVMFQKDLCNKVVTSNQMCLEHLIHCFLNHSTLGWGRETTIHLFPVYPAQQAGLPPVSTQQWKVTLGFGFVFVLPHKHNSHPLKEGRKVPWRNTVAQNYVRSAPQHSVPPSKVQIGFAPALSSEQRGEQAAGKMGTEK